MYRFNLNISCILFFLFVSISVFNPFVPLKASAVQSQSALLSPPAPPPPDVKGNDLMKSMNSYSDQEVSIGQGRIIGQNEIIDHDLVVIGADLTIYGTVNGDAVCIGGNLTVGPQAEIKGDLVNIGGKLEVDPSAKTHRERVNINSPFGFLKSMKGMDLRNIGEKISLIAKIMRIVMGCVFLMLLWFFALLLTTFMPRQFKNIEENLSNEFPKCVLLGLASMIAFPIIILGFVITLIGILAVPFLLMAFALCSLTGYVVFSRILGGRLLPQKTIMIQILAGLVLLYGPFLIGNLLLVPGGITLSAIGHVFRTVGIILFISANFIGLGAVVYSLFSKRRIVQAGAKQPNNFTGSSGNGDAQSEKQAGTN